MRPTFWQALLDKINNNNDWLLKNRPIHMKHTPKMMQLMKATGLDASRIKQYFHNCVRRGFRMVEGKSEEEEQRKTTEKKKRRIAV